MIKNLLKILLISSLSACNTPQIRDLDQKQIFLVFNDDGSLNIESSGCFVRLYRHSVDYIGPIGDAVEVPLIDCSKVIGYNPQDYGDLYRYQEQVRRIIKNHNRK